jgi:hypothetical protein
LFEVECIHGKVHWMEKRGSTFHHYLRFATMPTLSMFFNACLVALWVFWMIVTCKAKSSCNYGQILYFRFWWIWMQAFGKMLISEIFGIQMMFCHSRGRIQWPSTWYCSIVLWMAKIQTSFHFLSLTGMTSM